MTEQWYLLQAALRQFWAGVVNEPGPIKWLIAVSGKILDWLVR